MIPIKKMSFEEIGISKESELVSKDIFNEIVKRQSKWNGKITSAGSSLIHRNGVSISDWHGIFTTHTG